MDYVSFLTQRRSEILGLVSEAAKRSGRDASEIELIAVSKTVEPEAVHDAYQAGYRTFGENRPQELGRKIEALKTWPDMAGVRFDMIGNLQTNKINHVIGKARLIHSISSEHLARAVSMRAAAKDCTCQVLLEINVSGEESKSGFSPQEVQKAADKLMSLSGISICGLMTMAPQGDVYRARKTFAGLRELQGTLSKQMGLPLSVLSCGMSDDFPLAVQEGSTMIRLGRLVFSSEYAVSSVLQ